MPDGQERDIYLNHSSNAGTDWKTEALLVSEGAGASESSYANVVTVGNIGHTAWQDARNGAFDVYYRRFKSGVG